MSITIEQLRYLHLGSRDPEASAQFACQVLGLQVAQRQQDEVAMRSDARAYTLVFAKAPPSRQALGLEVRDVDTLVRAAAQLAARGIEARRDDALAARRQVKALLVFTTPGGLDVELVVRPLHKGWRFFGTRDVGMLGLQAVALRTGKIVEDEALWTEVFGLRVNDWVGDAAYLGNDAAHHRIALHPAAHGGVLAVEFAVESCDQVMQQYHRLRESGPAIVHGPGRRPASAQVFLTFAGPDQVHYSLVAEGRSVDATDRPRQFAAGAESHCAWGSDCLIEEYLQSGVSARPQLREVGRQ